MSDFNSYPQRPHKGDRLYWPLQASPVRSFDFDSAALLGWSDEDRRKALEWQEYRGASPS